MGCVSHIFNHMPNPDHQITPCYESQQPVALSLGVYVPAKKKSNAAPTMYAWQTKIKSKKFILTTGTCGNWEIIILIGK